MTSLKVLSLDLFETLVHFKAQEFDSRSTLITALQKYPEVPQIPLEDLYSEYHQIVRSNMRNYDIEEEFRNDHILLDIWRNHGVPITPELEQTALNVIITYFENVTSLIQPFSGVYEVLDNLRDNYTLVLLSNHSWAPNGEEVYHIFNWKIISIRSSFPGKLVIIYNNFPKK